MVADRESSPSKPSRTIAPVIGTTSATVIQSSPSMKLTRFTNQRPASKKSPRSIQSGQAGNNPKIAGRRKEDRADGHRLQYQPWQNRDGFDVIREPYGCDEQRCTKNRDGDLHIRRASAGDDCARRRSAWRRSLQCRPPEGLERDVMTSRWALQVHAAKATAGSPRSYRPKASLQQGRRKAIGVIQK